MSLRRVALLAATALMVGFMPVLNASNADELPADQKAKFEALIHDYIIAHPEVIEEALVALQQKQQDDQQAEAQKALESVKEQMVNSPNQVVLGNPNGKITVVEFFDYNCTYCRHALPDMSAMISADKDLRFVLKETPVLGPDSVEAAKIAIAVNLIAPEKYGEFHKRLMSSRGRVGKDEALAVASAIGLDTAKVEQLSHGPKIGETLSEVNTLARKINLNGTPTYVVGNEVVYGAVGADELMPKIASIKNCGKTSC